MSWNGSVSMRLALRAKLLKASNDLIDLVLAVDGILQNQAHADTQYFLENCEEKVLSALQPLINHVGDTTYQDGI